MRIAMLEMMRTICSGIIADESLAENIAELSLKFRLHGNVDDAGMLYTLSEFHRYNAAKMREELDGVTDQYLLLCDDISGLPDA
ncbi:hypothetical protein [Methylobacterium nonmethylotrophicum]|uniref:Uncharacterized protein n=1 Tax=Methylobacterium nonmethylotrophicum TaxID=1141884 RepID=A0A4Z0NEG0_9HYPH|nr:hypothetical protein [Methylobacterium nonmethylotrophicum]TGD93724.1 hypothetical protein EU555_33080 [Methylobacterium nonmethylotrophicum]